MPFPDRGLSGARARVGRRLTAVLITVVPGLCLVPEAGTAAAPPPQASVHCGGSLKQVAPTSQDQHLLAYTFNCDGRITAYTLIINRGSSDGSTMDDFSTTALVNDNVTHAPVSTESFTCEGVLPGNGVNCNAGAGGFMDSPFFANGTFDTTNPYCSNIPAGSPAGTKPQPTALVQLVVSDTTGAQEGPFRLRLHRACPTVHVTKGKARTFHRHASKTGRRVAGTRRPI